MDTKTGSDRGTGVTETSCATRMSLWTRVTVPNVTSFREEEVMDVSAEMGPIPWLAKNCNPPNAVRLAVSLPCVTDRQPACLWVSASLRSWSPFERPFGRIGGCFRLPVGDQISVWTNSFTSRDPHFQGSFHFFELSLGQSSDGMHSNHHVVDEGKKRPPP